MTFFSKFYGVKQFKVSAHEVRVTCPACQNPWADMAFVSQCIHVHGVSLFPRNKSIPITCQRCGVVQSALSPTKRPLPSNYPLIQQGFSHPWYAYTGCFILLILIVATLLNSYNHFHRIAPIDTLVISAR